MTLGPYAGFRTNRQFLGSSHVQNFLAMLRQSRRSTLKTLGSAVAFASIPGIASAASDWRTVESPVAIDLHDAEQAADGAYAVGGAGDVLERTADGWERIVDGGPTGNGNDLLGSDVTDDGERLWFVGESGSVGEYDVATETLYDHSHPLDTGNNFSDVAVTGPAGEANVYASDQSGHVFYSVDNGEKGSWHYVTPGSGASLPAIDFFGTDDGHVVDTNQKVFATDDGETWDAVGIQNSGVNFFGVDSDGFDDVWVVGGNGTVFHYDGSQWVTDNLGDATLRDVELSKDDSDGYAVGEGGTVYDRSSGAWSRDDTPTGANLSAVVRGAPDIAVGASGTILEN